MATITGSFSKNNNNIGIYIEYSYDQSVANNTSTVYAKLYIKRKTSYGTSWMNQTPYSLTIGGTRVDGGTKRVSAGDVAVGGSVLVASGSKVINHNSDGTGSVRLQGVVDWTSVNPGYGSVDSTITLPTIPRKTSVSVSGTKKFGSTVTIHHAGASSSFRHNIGATIAGRYYSIAQNVSGTSTNWIIPESLQSNIPNSTSGNIKITLDTVSGGTVIGTSETYFDATLSDSCYPSISGVTFSDGVSKPYGVTGFWQNFSKLKSVISASGIYGSTIRSYRVKVDGVDIDVTSSSSTVTTGTLWWNGTYDVIVYVTDSRGRTASKRFSKAISITSYDSPTITSMSYKRTELVDGIESPSNMGHIGYISYSTSWYSSSTDRKYRFLYRTKSSSTWVTIDMYSSSYVDYKFSTSLSAADAYILRLEISDQLQTVVKEIEMVNIFPLISMNPKGTGLAFGKEATTDYLIDIDMNVKIGRGKKITKNADGQTWLNAARGNGVMLHMDTHEGYAPIISQKTTDGVWTQGVYSYNRLYFSYLRDTDIANSNNQVFSQYKLDVREGYWTVLGISDYNTLNNDTLIIDTESTNAGRGLTVKGSAGQQVNLWAGSGASVVMGNKALNLGAFGSSGDINILDNRVEIGKKVWCHDGFGTDTIQYYSSGGYGGDWGIGCNTHFYPTTKERYLGVSNRRWQGLYCVYSPNISSDRRLKENIQYIPEDNNFIMPLNLMVLRSTDTSLQNPDMLTSVDFLNFIKNDLKLATYKYKLNEDSANDKDATVVDERYTQVGFIAQDIVDTKVGSYVITKDSNGILGYETGNYTNVIAGALQEEIKLRETEIKNIKNTLNMVLNELEELRNK